MRQGLIPSGALSAWCIEQSCLVNKPRSPIWGQIGKAPWPSLATVLCRRRLTIGKLPPSRFWTLPEGFGEGWRERTSSGPSSFRSLVFFSQFFVPKGKVRCQGAFLANFCCVTLALPPPHLGWETFLPCHLHPWLLVTWLAPSFGLVLFSSLKNNFISYVWLKKFYSTSTCWLLVMWL